MKLTVSLDRDEDGIWIIECPSIPGCVSQGSTRENALENIKEAIQVVISITNSERKQSISLLKISMRSDHIEINDHHLAVGSVGHEISQVK